MCGRVTIFVVANLDHGHFKAKLVSHRAELLDVRLDRLIGAPIDCGRLTVGPVEVRDFVRELVAHLGWQDFVEALGEGAHSHERDGLDAHVPDEHAASVVPLAEIYTQRVYCTDSRKIRGCLAAVSRCLALSRGCLAAVSRCLAADPQRETAVSRMSRAVSQL